MGLPRGDKATQVAKAVPKFPPLAQELSHAIGTTKKKKKKSKTYMFKRAHFHPWGMLINQFIILKTDK